MGGPPGREGAAGRGKTEQPRQRKGPGVLGRRGRGWEQEERSTLPLPGRTGVALRTEFVGNRGWLRIGDRSKEGGSSPWRTPETPSEMG